MKASARPKLVEPAGFTTQARAELALVIAERNHLQASCDAAGGGYTLSWDHPAQQALLNAEMAITAAEERLDEARKAITTHHHAVALGEAAGEAPTLREARADLADAKDAAEAARIARDGVQQIGIAAADRLKMLTWRFDNAMRAVIAEDARAAAEKVSAQVQTLQRQLAETGLLLQWLVNHGAVPLEGAGHTGRPLDRATSVALNHVSFGGDYWHGLRQASQITEPWDAALKALAQDATAPLPEIA